MAVPYTFGTATAAIPLSQLDSNFATTITLGNTAVQLGNTVTTLNNMTLANVTVSSGSVTLTNIAVTTANVTTANIGTAVITGTSTLTGLTASTALALDASKNIVSVTNTGSGNNVLGTSPTIATPTINTITSAASTALTLQSNNGNTAVTVDTSQNVGIGTTSPVSKLAVAGTITTSAGITYNGGSTMTIDQAVSAGALILRTGTSSYMRFDTNGSTEQMRIDSSGNVLIGATSGGGKLSITGTGSSGWVQNNINSGTASTASIVFTNGNGVVGSILTSGSATTYSTSSDYRLKEDIAPMTGALATVASLKPVTYKWKVDGAAGQGFIAHELQAVVPDCVNGEKDAVDANGNPQYQGVDTSFLVATLTAAIQELSAKNDALEARLAALEAK